MPSLVETVIGAIPPDMVPQLAGFLGTSPSATSSAIAAAAPTLLAGAANQASTPAGASDLLRLVTRATAGANPLDRVGSVLSADERTRSAYVAEGGGLADTLLGGRTSAVASLLEKSTGVGAGAFSKILALLAPLVLGAIGRVLGPSPSVTGLQSLLAGERSSIMGALPAGLGGLLGIGGAASGQAAKAAAPAAAGMGRFLPWILAAVVALIVLFALRTCMTKRPEPAAPTPATPVAEAPRAPAQPQVKLNLPGGGQIDVAEGSIGQGVARYLESNEPAPKTFIFDNLNFDTASNAVTPESRPTLVALVAILKAYPNADARIVGYTDNQGEPAANKALSDARAAAVKADLVAGGVAADRLQTAGMGEANPVADNATEQGRADNRRTELVIVKK